jgi:transposase
MLRVAGTDRRLQREKERPLHRGDLSATEWRDVKELLATARSSRGRPPENTRAVINGILWRLRTGAPWRDVPGRYGDWNKIYRRFRRWSQSGIWASVATVLGDVAANGDAAAPPARGNGRVNRRPMPGAGARSRLAKGQGGAGLSAAVRPGARAAAGLASTRRSARSAAR